MANHVLNCLKTHRGRFSGRSNPVPLFVGVQGPQGSGKTFLTSRLSSLLADPPYSLSAAVLSIDDLYLPHARLTALADAHPQNLLLHGRGQPGTHDVALGRSILAELKAINASSDAGADAVSEVVLPMFDKSLYDGAGDRTAETRIVRAPIDVVVLEGWCVGFYPASRADVEAQWSRGVPELEGAECPNRFDMRAFVGFEEVLEVNTLLREYVAWWEALDAFVQIRGPPMSSLSIIYRWRLQQEQDMKSRNGGRGMTDEQITTFVDRYIPGYVFFGDSVTQGTLDEQGKRRMPPWQGQGLLLQLDLERQLVGISQF